MHAQPPVPRWIWAILALASAMAAGGFVRTALSPLQETMRIALALSDNQMALLQGPAIGVPALLCALPLGLLIDRTPRVRLLAWLLSASLAGSLLTAVASNFPLLLFARALAGLAGINVVPVVLSLIADMVPPDRRGRATTLAIVGQVAGNSAAFMLGGALLGVFGTDDQGWRIAMAVLSLPILLPLAIMLLVREPARLQRAAARPTLGQIRTRLAQLGGGVFLLAAGIVLIEMAVGATLIWAAPMLARDFALSPASVGAFLGTAMLASGLVGPALGGAIADWCERTGGPPRTAAALALATLASVPLSLFALAPDHWLMSILLVLQMVVLLALAVAGIAMFTIVTPGDIRGICTATLMAAILFAALAIAPPTVSLLSQLIGGEAAIGDALSIVCVAATLAASAAFGSTWRALRR